MMQLELFKSQRLPNLGAQGRAEIMAMSDAELNRLIAKRIMDVDPETAPAYSTNMCTALKVAERMRPPGTNWLTFAGIVIGETGACEEANRAGPAAGLLPLLLNLTPRIICQAALIAVEEGGL